MLKNNSNKRGLNEKKNIELHFFFLGRLLPSLRFSKFSC